MRQVILDTETTGLDPKSGHRVIEIGCVELINRRLTGRHYHQYINPQREIDAGAIEVHGITNQMLADKPVFAEIADEFMAFVQGAELIIHNAPFDIGFLNNELRLDAPRWGALTDHCRVIDTLVMAREKHPGQRNSLDALCSRYGIDNSGRELHGALLDSEILADVYLAMTGGQTALLLADEDDVGSGPEQGSGELQVRRLATQRGVLPVIRASAEELAAHEAYLTALEKKGGALWKQLGAEPETGV